MLSNENQGIAAFGAKNKRQMTVYNECCVILQNSFFK
jgi:hypothetical protein